MKMEMHNFRSTAIWAAAYDPDKRLLVLCFTSNPHMEYDYPGVPAHIWQGLVLAPSKGRYYNDHIRDIFGAHRVERTSQHLWR